MIIAIPLEDGKLCQHFGHCAKFALIQTDDKNAITARRNIDAPPHEPGLLPTWLHERSVNLIICGGMGPRALELFEQKGIDVITGAPIETPEALIAAHFTGTLQTAPNSCDH
ncbi:MAG: NifB/NifX family molybdenum-iron cluster-binding protein [Alphaproteobacteria bacterium]|nr:NifB/NifX family molybdenum-iron cluster-binding protein [Alphaproteobacteria bacterium]